VRREEGASGGRDAAPARRKTILLPHGDEQLARFLETESPVPVRVVSDAATPLDAFDLALLVVESVDPPMREAVARVLAEGRSYVVLVHRDVWSAADEAAQGLLDDVQRDPRRKLIRFWRERADLEQTIREEVFLLDDVAYVGQSARDGAFVKVGTRFEQTWEIENTGFRVWEGRALRELASERLEPEESVVPLAPTGPGERVNVSVGFRAPDEPASCASVWQVIGMDGRVAFPWSPGLRCQVRAVL
jgi:hypothetical protein